MSPHFPIQLAPLRTYQPEGAKTKMKVTTWVTVGTAAVWTLVSAQACKSDEPSSPDDNLGGTSGDGDGDVPGTGGTSSGGGFNASGGSTQTTPCDLDEADVRPLPYDVSEDFDYVNEIPEGVSSARVVEDATCDDSGRNAGGAGGEGGAGGIEGSCYVFDYVPDDDEDAETPSTWGGVIVQSNEMDDGLGSTGEGICVEPGATSIRFEAKADNDITDVKFGAIRPGPGLTEHWIRLTSEWAEYTISIPPTEPYNASTETGGVWNGFSAVLEPNNQDTEALPEVTRISIRNVTWEE